MKILHAVFALIPSILLTGCFTAMSRSAGSWTGDTSISPGAAALDVVTAPIQAPFWIVAGVGHVASGNRAEQQRLFRQRFIDDASFRQGFIYDRNLRPENLQFLADEKMAELVRAEDVRYLWTRFKNTATGIWHSLIIAPGSTPPDVLGEYYHWVLAGAEEREGKPSPRELVYYQRLLLHPNLPPEIIAEIRSYSIESLDQILSRRKA